MRGDHCITEGCKNKPRKDGKRCWSCINHKRRTGLYSPQLQTARLEEGASCYACGVLMKEGAIITPSGFMVCATCGRIVLTFAESPARKRKILECLDTSKRAATQVIALDARREGGDPVGRDQPS